MIPALAIFDCDGVLVDSEGPTNALLAEDLHAHGLDVPEAQIPALFVGGTMEGVFHKARAMGAALPDDWVDRFYSRMFARLAEGVPMIDGVGAVIDALEARGVPIWVASNGPMAKMEITLTPHGLWDRFAGRILSRDGFAPKPAPDMVLHALAASATDRAQAVMIDDSPTGCGAGIAAGIRTIGYAEETDPDRLRAAGAEIARSMPELAAMLGIAEP